MLLSSKSESAACKSLLKTSVTQKLPECVKVLLEVDQPSLCQKPTKKNNHGY